MQIPPTSLLKQQKCISHRSGGWKSKVRLLEDLIPGEDSLPGLETAGFSMCHYLVERGSFDLSFSYKDTNPFMGL